MRSRSTRQRRHCLVKTRATERPSATAAPHYHGGAYRAPVVQAACAARPTPTPGPADAGTRRTPWVDEVERRRGTRVAVLALGKPKAAHPERAAPRDSTTAHWCISLR